MMAYCENCSRKELMIQLLTDAWRLRNLSPAGIGMSGLDLLVRNSPLPNTVEGGFRDAREWIENYETIFGENGNDQGGNNSREARFQNMGSLRRFDDSERLQTRKKKRKVSRYQREFGKQLKALKKKHPRTPITRLMKRAHTATKKALK